MTNIPDVIPQKTAIVTGAGTGIGAAIACHLAARGCKVVLGGRTSSTLDAVAATIRAAGGLAEAVVCDVTKADDVVRLVAAAGPTLDILVHSAGKGHCLTIDEIDEQEFRETFEVAVLGAFLTAKHALPALRAGTNGCGHIIQIASLASGGTWYKEVGYGTAKGAQLKFALHLASQLEVDAYAGGRTIHVHAVCPGTTDTPFWKNIPQRTIEPHLCLQADEIAWVVDRILDDPATNADKLAQIRPRQDIVIKRHAPFERWDNVIAIAHESHP